MWWKKILQSFALALENVRTNLFHTFLSVLGIVIGVAALVAILSFIDGLELYARDQITRTTTLKAVVISGNPYKVVNEVRIRKDTVCYLDYARFVQLRQALGSGIGRSELQSAWPSEIRV